jgi:hypothetical protein
MIVVEIGPDELEGECPPGDEQGYQVLRPGTEAI